MSAKFPINRLTQQRRVLQAAIERLRDAALPGEDSCQPARDVAVALDELHATLVALEVFEEELRQQAETQGLDRAKVEAERRFYHELFDSAPDAYLVTDRWGLILTANQAAARLLNVDAPKLRGQRLPRYFSMDSRHGLRQRLLRLSECPLPLEWEDRVQPRHRPVVEVAVAMSLRSATEHGQPVELLWRLHNVAALREAEQALRDSEERYHRLVHTSLEAIFLYDAYTRQVLKANPSCQRLLGYSAAEVQNLTLYDISGNDRASIEDFWRQIMAGGQVELGERRWRRKDGEMLAVQVTASKIRQGHRHIIAVIGRDISAQKAAEDQLRESEARFRRLAENAPDIIYRYRLEPTPHFEYISPAVTSLLGFSPEEFYADPELSLRQTHPDDRQILRAVVTNPALAGQLTIVRRIHKDGQLLWTEQRPVVLYDASGQPVAVEGIIRDITTQKELENDRVRSAALISALSQVAAQLQDKLEPDSIIATMVAELARYEIVCVVLLAGTELCLNVRHVDLNPERLALASATLGAPLPGHRFPLARLPHYEALWVQRQPVYLEALTPEAATAFGNLPEAQTARDLDPHGRLEDWHGICAPLVAENQPLGLLLMWGANLREADLPAVVVFASQVSSALENARLFEAEREHRALAEALRQTAELLNTSLEYEQLLDQILVHAEGLLHYDWAQITLIDGNESLINRRSRGLVNLIRGDKAGQTRWALADFPLLRELVASKQPMTIPDTHAHPRWVLVPEWAWVRSQVLAPLRMKGTVTGYIALSSGRINFYSQGDAPRLQALADQAAVALENATLFEQLRRGREQLQALSQRLLEVQESERRLIARELHDEIGQQLTGLQLFIEAGNRAPDGAKLVTAQVLVDELISRVRDLSLELRPTMLDDLGLVPALLWHFERYTMQTGIEVSFQHFGIEQRFDPDLETAAYRIVQEALTNVARHAGVQTASVNLWADAATLNVQIEDAGAGFDPALVRANHNSSGLAGMLERVTLLHGQFTVEAAPEAGTQITAELPVRAAPRVGL